MFQFHRHQENNLLHVLTLASRRFLRQNLHPFKLSDFPFGFQQSEILKLENEPFFYTESGFETFTTNRYSHHA